MDIVKSTNDISSKIEEKFEKGLEKTKEIFTNVASHLPFANFGKKNSDVYNIEVDLPGVKKEDIELKVEDKYLQINAIRHMKKEVKEEDYYLLSSHFGKISRVFVLPEGINKDSIKAKFEDGRLYIEIEKEESKKAKVISIK
jgi:HSP20 family protein